MRASLEFRTLTPEWLDTLPPEDPRALRSRRDLVLINALMRNAGGIVAVLRALPLARVAELGAGTGRVLANVAERLQSPRGVNAVLVDSNPCIEESTARRFARAGWQARRVRADVFAWLEEQEDDSFDAIVANLFLHHFDDVALRRMLALVSRKAGVFVACEPRRTRFAEHAARLLPLLGCNDVTRHDSVVSVQAGFCDRELSSLWPAGDWRCEERRWGAFTHRFAAVRP